MRHLPKFAFVCLIALVLTACDSGSNANVSRSSTAPMREDTSSVPRQGGGGGGGNEEPRAEKVSLEQADKAKTAPSVTERKIIRNANLTLETPTPEDAGRKIAAIAESKGGFVVTSDTKTTNSASGAASTSVQITVRVPAAQFDAAVDEIRKTSNRVVQEKVAGQDVTEEFIDLEARINAKKALEAQFLEIMKQSRSVTDALEVQRQLSEVRGEIEKLEGRRKFLENQTALSTIVVSLQPPTQFAASSSGFFYELGRAFSDGINAALAVVLFLIRAFLALLPILILLGVPLWLLWRYLRRKIQRRKLAQELVQEEKS